jgi:hypothetical protein
MEGSFRRVIAADHNRFVQGCGSLMGIAAGLIADRALSNGEIQYLEKWLEQNAEMATRWPGDVIYDRVRTVLSDGVIRRTSAHLVETLTTMRWTA